MLKIDFSFHEISGKISSSKTKIFEVYSRFKNTVPTAVFRNVPASNYFQVIWVDKNHYHIIRCTK